MPVDRFYEGQRVVIDYYTSYNDFPNGYVGTIRRSDGRYAFESDIPDSRFHSCNGGLPLERGWFVDTEVVSEINKKCSREKSGFGKFIQKVEKKTFIERTKRKYREAKKAKEEEQISL